MNVLIAFEKEFFVSECQLSLVVLFHTIGKGILLKARLKFILVLFNYYCIRNTNDFVLATLNCLPM